MKNLIHKAEHLGISFFLAAGLCGFGALAWNTSGNFRHQSRSEIRQAQQELRLEGYYHGGLSGTMSPATVHALRQYQRMNNLYANGRLDQQTVRSLGITYGSEQGYTGEASRSAEEPYLSSHMIRQAQRQLKTDSLYTGSIDGIVGPETRSAVWQYQQKNNLAVNGMLDRQTLRNMGLSSSNQYNPSSTNTNTTTQPNTNQSNPNQQ
jgi:peptidoglycan hydrolase-like protein with peptidoglycan-binding domain